MSGFWGGLVFGLAGALVIALGTIMGVWAERKISGRIQMRIGPQELGPFGLLQVPADTLKMMLKEDITPRNADARIFRFAPYVVFVPVAMGLVVIPFAVGWAPLDTSIGVLFFLAVPSLSSIGMLLGGWSSRNTYATLGGMRAAAQMISYELPRTLSVLSIVLLAGSVRPLDVLDAWRVWWLPLIFVAFIVYYISSVAELNRGPFDIPEAESELVAGYFADYSGIRWGIFMMAEYGGLVAAALFGSAMFLGATRWLPGAFGVVVFVLVAAAIASSMIWIKWTFPRMRPDQLMRTAWKVLTPIALVQLAVVGVVVPWL